MSAPNDWFQSKEKRASLTVYVIGERSEELIAELAALAITKEKEMDIIVSTMNTTYSNERKDQTKSVEEKPKK